MDYDAYPNEKYASHRSVGSITSALMVVWPQSTIALSSCIVRIYQIRYLIHDFNVFKEINEKKRIFEM